jgi:hypothetical protein
MGLLLEGLMLYHNAVLTLSLWQTLHFISDKKLENLVKFQMLTLSYADVMDERNKYA